MATSSRDTERIGLPLPATNEAAQLGRRLVRRYLAEWRAQDLIDAAKLVTSELVMNVVSHTKSAVAYLELQWHDPTLRISISDTSTEPPVVPCGLCRDGGFGLRIVAALADDNGVIARSKGKTVWCTLSLK